METKDLTPLIEDLDDSIDGLEEALGPLLTGDLSSIAAKLPLLEKAKLHALIAYAIESLLFSHLKLNGIDAKEHPVYRELARVKQYFEKLKSVEAAGQRSHALDAQAASRFIKHALAGNEKHDKQHSWPKSTNSSVSKTNIPETNHVAEYGTKKRRAEATSNSSTPVSESDAAGSLDVKGQGGRNLGHLKESKKEADKPGTSHRKRRKV